MDSLRPYLLLAVALLAAVDAGCAASDERYPDMPLAANLYDPMDHLPPASDSGGPPRAEVERIHGLFRTRKFMPAVQELDTLISERTGSEQASDGLPELLVLRGMAQCKLHHPGAARADYDRALALDKEYWPAYFHRWQCHLELGNRSAAEADREAGRKLAPKQFERDYDPHPAGMI